MTTLVCPAQSFQLISLTLSQILCISIYYASECVNHDSLNADQHQWVFIHLSSVNLADLLQAEVIREHSSDTSIEKEIESRLESELEEEADWNVKTLMKEELIQTEQDTSAELESDESKAEKKGEKMLITDKTHLHFHKSLTDVAVFTSEEIQDDLWRLVQGYLNKRVSLLKLKYQPWNNSLCLNFNELK